MANKFIKRHKSYRTRKWLLSYDTFNTLKNNFYIGIARGIGTALGFSVLGAIVLVIIQFIPLEQIPFIGKLFQEFNNIIRSRLG